MRIASFSLACLCAALLAACGSRPVPVPGVVTSSKSDMAKAMLAYDDNRYSEARSFFGRALADYQSVDDVEHEVEVLSDLADSALLQGDVAAARTYLDAAGKSAAQERLTGLTPRLTLLAAYADLESADPASAATKLDSLLNEAGLAPDMHQAALYARVQAAFDQKAPDAAQWLARIPAAKDDPLAAARLDRLQALADPARGAALYADALGRYQTAYYRPGIAAAHEEWGRLLLSQKDWAGARDHLHRALAVRLWMNDANRSAQVLTDLAQADTALGDAAAAKQDAEWADYLKNGGDPAVAPNPKDSQPQ
jgi:hypothetical protein